MLEPLLDGVPMLELLSEVMATARRVASSAERKDIFLESVRRYQLFVIS
jgi:hypothetical protein